MSDLTLDGFWEAEAELVKASPQACENIDKCITHTWHHKLFTLSDYRSKCAGENTVRTVAVPQSKQVFEFTVLPREYRLLHIIGWDYPCNTDGLILRRLARGVFSQCGDDVIEYDMPRGCGFTFLPGGTYRVTLNPVPVNVSNEAADGAELDVSIALESVDQHFLDAVLATRS